MSGADFTRGPGKARLQGGHPAEPMQFSVTTRYETADLIANFPL